MTGVGDGHGGGRGGVGLAPSPHSPFTRLLCVRIVNGQIFGEIRTEDFQLASSSRCTSNQNFFHEI